MIKRKKLKNLNRFHGANKIDNYKRGGGGEEKKRKESKKKKKKKKSTQEQKPTVEAEVYN